jgi:hypothetical protein
MSQLARIISVGFNDLLVSNRVVGPLPCHDLSEKHLCENHCDGRDIANEIPKLLCLHDFAS